MLETLNEKQRQAVQHIQGPLVIIAGPGTGKTKTLTTKIAYLIENNHAKPHEILALTFTKKAANEMRERVQSILPSNQNTPLITTFHALGYELLKQYNKDLKIISESQQKDIVQAILASQPQFKEHQKQNIRETILQVSKHKSSLEQDINDETFQNLIQTYAHTLKSDNLLDYDDLILLTYQELKNNEAKRKDIQKTYQYILIDEFQDTAPLQYELIKLLLNEKNNLMVIGDPLQSIYSFRGADRSIFNKIQSDFPANTTILLNTNYRSHQNIITISSQLFPDTPKLLSTSSLEGTVQILQTLNEFSEADWIIEQINTKIGGSDLLNAAAVKSDAKNIRFSDIAIIYRTHSIKKFLEEKLHNSGIPYQIVGSTTYYEHSYIQSIVSLLNYLSNSTDEAWNKIQFKDKEFIKTDLQLLNTKAVLTEIIDQLYKLINPKLIETQEEKIILHQFQSTAHQFQNYEYPIQSLLNYIDTLTQNEFYDPLADQITLLTIHASKGLEFKYVYIVGFEEGNIPHIKKFAKQEANIEEEKRLLYVAMTRAKEELYLTQTKFRNKTATDYSQFHTQIQHTALLIQTDPNMQKIEKRIKKQKDKKSQLSLF